MLSESGIKPKFLLLDTHVWVWLLNGNNVLAQKKYLQLIEEYVARDAVRVSAISIWELGMLVAKKRLTLSMDIRVWIKNSFNNQGLVVEPLSMDILLDSTQAGDDFHGDPADRMLVATARNIDALIMTADEKIIKYCKKLHLMVEPVH